MGKRWFASGKIVELAQNEWYSIVRVCGKLKKRRIKIMIKKIAIIPYVTNGRNSQVGCDGHFNIKKKKEILY